MIVREADAPVPQLVRGGQLSTSHFAVNYETGPRRVWLTLYGNRIRDLVALLVVAPRISHTIGGIAMPVAHIHGIDFAWRSDGPESAPALLLSNSLSSDLAMWDDQVPSWSRHFRVIRYDQRGHGQTPAPPGQYSMAQLGQDAVALLDHLEIAQAHFCGLSMGGMVGMWLLTHAPERIARAVLSNTSAHMGAPELWNGRIALAQEGGMEATVEPTVKRWFPIAFHEHAPATIERMRNMIRRTSLPGYIGCCTAIRDMDQRDAIRAIRNPTLVIIGANDPATTPEAGRAIHAAIPGAALAVVDAAHISNVEQPDAFTRTVAEFLVT